jgi:enoyl-[acyl-carrier-protein] reductase (NADH)
MLDQENIADCNKISVFIGVTTGFSCAYTIGKDFSEAMGRLLITYGRDTNENVIDQFLVALKKSLIR